MTASGRVLWRLLRGVAQVTLGLFICAVLFPFWSEPRRMRCVGWWSRGMLSAIGVGLHARGAPSPGPILIVGNHVSWVDILAINAVNPARFVSKAEVRRWFLVGWLAAAGGTLFIERQRRRDAVRVVHSIAEALSAGQTVVVFPEGTVGDGHSLLPFHANLLQAAITAGVAAKPVAVRYTDKHGSGPSSAVDYHGDITIVQSLRSVLSADGLTVTVTCLPVVAGRDDRRALSEDLRAAIDNALSEDGADAALVRGR